MNDRWHTILRFAFIALAVVAMLIMDRWIVGYYELQRDIHLSKEAVFNNCLKAGNKVKECRD